MKKLTKKTRHKIYVQALKRYKEYYEGSFGICWALTQALYDLSMYSEDTAPIDHMDLYPEILKHKPEIPFGAYWWPRRYKKIRLNALEQSIEETK